MELKGFKMNNVSFFKPAILIILIGYILVLFVTQSFSKANGAFIGYIISVVVIWMIYIPKPNFYHFYELLYEYLNKKRRIK